MVERPSPRLGRALGRLSLLAAARPKQTIAWILVLTAVVGFGMVQLESDADLLKLLPKGDPNTHAAQNASREFRGFYDFVTVFYEIAPEKCAVANRQLPYRTSEVQCGNITDEVYIRAMEELGAFFMAHHDGLAHRIDLPNIIKTVNWTNSGYFGRPDESIVFPILGGQPTEVGRPVDSAFAMPGTDPIGELQYESAWRAANAVDESVNDVVSPEFKAGRTLFFFNSSRAADERVALGRAFYATVDAYNAQVKLCDADPATCPLAWNVFQADVFPVRGVSTLDAHASDVTRNDITLLAPIILLAIVGILYFSFWDLRVVLVALTNLLLAFVWTAGSMGWLHIPFSALNMTIVPLILGVGIDYGIHMVSEFFEHKSEGDGHEEAFRKAGVRAGLAMLIATVTTAAGLLLMVFSPSLLMGQLAVVSSIALVVTFLFTLTFIPAVLSLMGRDGGRKQRGSQAILGLARGVHHARWPVVIVVLLLSGAAVVGLQNLQPEPFGNPDLNYPKGDRVRDDADTIGRLFFGGTTDAQTNYLIVEGDLTQPQAHVLLDTLEANLRADKQLAAFNTATLTRVVRAWVAIDQGTPDAALSQLLARAPPETGLPDAQYPKTAAEMEATYDAIFASPFANFMTILLSGEGYRLGMVAFDTRQDLSYADVEKVWAATAAAVLATQTEVYGKNQDEPGYEGPRVHQFGNNAFSHLFISKQQPWVNWIGIVSFVLVAALIALLTRNVRATLCTSVIMGLTGLWWFGLLPSLGVGLSVGLMLPIVFIMAIGSDDAIHLVWNMERTGDPDRVYRHVGKAVFLTSITTVVAFGIFHMQTDLLVRRTLLATAVAVAIMWLATMLVVPLFYPPTRPRHGHGRPGARPLVHLPPEPVALAPTDAPHSQPAPANSVPPIAPLAGRVQKRPIERTSKR
jgi:predicted RND superfamily exporter protein